MSTIATHSPNRKARSSHRWIRQLHLWIGAWGALAAVLYGLTGLVMNHRFGDNKWPQGDSADAGKRVLSVPRDVRGTPEALSLWLQQTQGLEAQVIRKPPPGSGPNPPRWTLTGGTASRAWTVEYAPGDANAEYKTTLHSPLSALNRLHKAVGGSIGWIILADSFAICMLLLGLSGIWMWTRGRSTRQVFVSVLAASTVVSALVLVPALL